MGELMVEIVDLDPQETVAVRGDVAPADLPAFFARAFHEAAEAASASGVAITGPPFGFYPEMPKETVVVEAGFPVASSVETHGAAHRLVLPGGRAVRATHGGPVRDDAADLRGAAVVDGAARCRAGRRDVGVLSVRPPGRT